MNQTNPMPLNTPWLTPWQRRAVIIVGALAGAVAAAAVIRWLNCRREAVKAEAKRSNADE
jgi:hypothetical protein